MAVNKIFIPTLISSINYEPVRTLPHIYFYNGLKDSEPYFIQHYPSGSVTSSVVVSEQNSFPYVDYYDGLIPSTGSNSLLFFNEQAVYGETPTASLYSEYWETYVSLLYNPRTRLFNASAIIPLADYFEMELNDIVQWRGNYYHLRAINEYNLKNGTCKIELLGPIIRDAVGGVEPPTPQVDCTFDFSSSFEGIATTTTTSTTTTTTAGPTTTTTTTTSTTTTAAPTTTTTSTTTFAPAYYLVIEGGENSGGNYSYINEVGQTITGSLVTNQRILVGAVSASATVSGLGSQLFYSNTIYNTAFVSSSVATSFTVTNDSPPYTNSDKVVFYVPKNGTTLTYAWLPATSSPDSVTVCASYTSSFQVVSTSDATITNNGSC